jgi:hypothetical protein
MTTDPHQFDGKCLVFDTVALGTGDRVAECVDTDGTVAYWLLRPLCARHEADAVHGSVAGAPHEQLGLLPNQYQNRVRAVPLRCGHPTHDGRGCRSRVPGIGEVCHLHRPSTAGDGK